MSNLIFIFYESKKWPIKGVYQNIIKKCFALRAQRTAFEKFSKLILLNMAQSCFLRPFENVDYFEKPITAK